MEFITGHAALCFQISPTCMECYGWIRTASGSKPDSRPDPSEHLEAPGENQDFRILFVGSLQKTAEQFTCRKERTAEECYCVSFSG
jgi:hypothetical protein